MIERIVDYGERLYMALLVLPFLMAFAVYLPGHPYAIALAVSETLSVLFILIRKPGDVPLKPYPVLIAFLGTGLPLLARPGGMQVTTEFVPALLMNVGLAITISAKVALNRSFGVLAANRGIKVRGPYRLVRHPMYLGYVLTQVGFLLSSFSIKLICIYGVAWAVQVLRIIEEENVLMRDATYREYAAAVPRRLFPGF